MEDASGRKRLEALEAARAEFEGDLSPFEPGGFGCHEAFHMASALSVVVDDQLVQHPAVLLRPEWYRLASEALGKLAELHHAIGVEHLGPDA